MAQTTTTAYVDLRILCLLAQGSISPAAAEQRAMNRVWRRFEEGDVRLVTSEEETETDIIRWLNSRGICITDTLRAVESIEEFEWWGKADSEETKPYKRVIFYFEELNYLTRLAAGDESGEGVMDEDARRRLWQLLGLGERGTPGNDLTEDRLLLRECLTDLGNWYTETFWRELKRTDYGINWMILESILGLRGMALDSSGPASDRNRNLFGLLNRAIGLGKKSCGHLPMPENHIDFILNMVTAKYSSVPEDRLATHLLFCLRRAIPFFITMDESLLGKDKGEGLTLPGVPAGNSTRLLTPSAFLAHITT